MDDVLELNRQAWDQQSRSGASPWVQPVDPATITKARLGEWQVILTPTRNVPPDWFDGIGGKDLLALASGGGQQVPILAAGGANVTSFDNSPEQLAKDQFVAEREGLDIRIEQGDMADLSRFQDACFDLVFHPVANVFCPEILPVWQECFRVLRPGGRLMAGFMNPCFFLFDHAAIARGSPIEVAYPLPYRDPDHLGARQIRARINQGQAVEFSHSLDDQIGGQLITGFTLCGFYEDHWTNSATPLNQYMPTSMATLALKPG